MPAPRSGQGHIVLPLFLTLLITPNINQLYIIQLLDSAVRYVFQNNPKNLDPSDKKNLDIMDRLGREKPCFILKKYSKILVRFDG